MSTTNNNLAEQITRISGINPRKCMKCGKCSGACPAFDEMEYHPHQFVSKLLSGEIEDLMNSESIWNCLSCMACVERCPRSVAPAKVIEEVRDSVVRQQYVNHFSADEVPQLLNEDLPQQAITCAFRRYSK